MKPSRACDVDFAKLRFPVIGMPKIDGVRAINLFGKLTARTLKPHGNRYVTEQFSNSALIGFDGEMAAWSETAPDLCRRTSSALSKRDGQPWIMWWLFDYVTVETKDMPYVERLGVLEGKIKTAPLGLQPHLKVVPWRILHNMEELEAYDAENLAAGFEGTITRDPDRPHKDGYATAREGGYGRIKRFVDFEFTCTRIVEGQQNLNEATTNALGNTERSTHQENMVPNGMIGAMYGVVIGDVKSLDGKTILFKDGEEVKVGAGRLDHNQRKHYFENQDEFKSQIHKGKFFPVGIKDEMRFPTWQTFRAPEDL